MTCNNETCYGQRINAELQDDNYSFHEEFVKNLQHEKCKAIQLVRKQMQKAGEFTKHESYSIPDAFHRKVKLEYQDVSQEVPALNVNKETNVELHNPPLAGSSKSVQRTWPVRILRKFRRPICKIMIAFVIAAGVVLLILFIYGACLGASLCNSRRFYITPFRYTPPKHLLF